MISIDNTDKVEVLVHPLVLLSAVDHHSRVVAGGKKRVAGVLLGEIKKTDNQIKIDITNSFAVPFEEDARDPSIWVLDHDYLEETAYL